VVWPHVTDSGIRKLRSATLRSLNQSEKVAADAPAAVEAMVDVGKITQKSSREPDVG